MIAAWRSMTDRLLGRGEAALTVPPLDGALKPNNRLEEAPPGIAAKTPLGLICLNGQVHWAEGSTLVSALGDRRELGGEVTALTASPAGRLAVALAGKGVQLDGQPLGALQNLDCVTALAFEGEAILWIAVGSTKHPYRDWVHDFMAQNKTGQVLRYDLAAQSVQTVATGLAFPFGLLPENGGVILSEAWAKRLIWLSPAGQKAILIDDLPGYPAGISPTPQGGYWLAIFAPRSPLLEFVLREPAYRRAMMAEVDPEFWISPAMRSGYSYSEPMQGGALKQMGILKPWAPTRSYGLVVEMSADAKPLQSLHSRAGGKRHGVTSVCEWNGQLWVGSQGGNEVLRLSVERGQ